jgi:hypothetical protein
MIFKKLVAAGFMQGFMPAFNQWIANGEVALLANWLKMWLLRGASRTRSSSTALEISFFKIRNRELRERRL